MTAMGVPCDQGGAFQRVQAPPGDSLQPEATGAGMEETKCLNPSDSGSRIGDRARVQAATRVNAEQASKRSMCRPTRRPLPGKADTVGGEERGRHPPGLAPSHRAATARIGTPSGGAHQSTLDWKEPRLPSSWLGAVLPSVT